jgi:parvulin-like peptidyl-prolyl isomerase
MKRFLRKKDTGLFRLLLWSFFSLFLAAPFQGCGTFVESEQDAALVVGDTTVSAEELKKDIECVLIGMGISPNHSLEQMKEPLLKSVIDQYVILEFGKQNGIRLTQEEIDVAWEAILEDFPDDSFPEVLLGEYLDFNDWSVWLEKRLLIDKIFREVTQDIPPPNQHRIQAYYQEHKKGFHSPPRVKFRQILVNSAETANGLLKRLKEGEDFHNLASQHSQAPESVFGGMVGWVAKGQLEESLDNALFSLAPGELSAVTKTSHGYHVFLVLAMRPAGVKQLPEVFREIESKLLVEEQESFFREWLTELKKGVHVWINQEAVNSMEFS